MLSLPHLVVIFVVALVIFGPEKLPELARMLGKATADFRRMTSEFRFALEREVQDLDRQSRIRDEEKRAAIPAPLVGQPMPEAPAAPQGTLPREAPVIHEVVGNVYLPPETSNPPQPVQAPPPETLATPEKKSPDDNAAA